MIHQALHKYLSSNELVTPVHHRDKIALKNKHQKQNAENNEGQPLIIYIQQPFFHIFRHMATLTIETGACDCGCYGDIKIVNLRLTDD